MRGASPAVLAFAALTIGTPLAFASPALPTKISDCAVTHIATIGHRLEDGYTHKPMTNSGSAISFTNGLYQVSYDELPEITRSRRGDPVLICLVLVPKHCPTGDDRGKIYTTTNLRTIESWTLPDSEHSCGGA